MTWEKKTHWQAPGNSKIFDSDLKHIQDDLSDSDDYISKRTVNVLKFFKNNNSFKDNLTLEREMDIYLEKNFADFNINKSIRKHFYRPLLFYGLLNESLENNEIFIELSIEGRIFLSYLENGRIESALEYFLYSLIRTSYPNHATKKVDGLFLFPFRIIFHLFIKYKSLNKNDFVRYIPYISSRNDVLDYENFKKNIDMTGVKPYDKFFTWVINSLKDIGLLWTDKENNYFLSSTSREIIEPLVKDIDNLFFEDDSVEYGQKKFLNYEQKNKRNRELVRTILEQYEYNCFLSNSFLKEHFSFKTPTMKNYLEVHHIVPISMTKIYDKNLDIEENLIPLCPNCHKMFHYSVNKNKTKIIDFVFENKIGFSKLEISVRDLKQIYLDNIYFKRDKAK